MNQELMNMVQQAVNSILDHVDFEIPNAFAEAFAKLVAAAERADMRKGFAGVTLWLGAEQVTQLVTETQIKYERNQGDALTLAAQKCLDIYAGARGDTK